MSEQDLERDNRLEYPLAYSMQKKLENTAENLEINGKISRKQLIRCNQRIRTATTVRDIPDHFPSILLYLLSNITVYCNVEYESGVPYVRFFIGKCSEFIPVLLEIPGQDRWGVVLHLLGKVENSQGVITGHEVDIYLGCGLITKGTISDYSGESQTYGTIFVKSSMEDFILLLYAVINLE